MHVDLAHSVTGDGPDLVLVHGWTGAGRDWQRVVAPLAATNRVWTVDLRGHGESPHLGSPDGYTFDLLVDDLAAWVDAVGLDGFHLLGHSMGGLTAMRYALASPGKLASLVLLDTGAAPNVDGKEWMDGLAAFVDEQGTGAYLAGLMDLAGADMADDQRETTTWMVEHVDPVALSTFARRLCDYESVLPALASLRLPTTVIVGELDAGLRGASDDLAATIPDARLVVIEGAAHSPHWEQTDAFLDALRAHVDRVG